MTYYLGIHRQKDRFVLVSGMEATNIGLKYRWMRGYMINCDSAWVDKRRLARMRRRNLKRARAAGFVLESNPRRLDRMWFRSPSPTPADKP